MAETATAILERRRAEGEVLLNAQRQRERESREAWQAYAESLPRLAYVPTGDPESGQAFVRCDVPQVFAYDGHRVWLAAVRGHWVPEDRARKLGLDGPAIVLASERDKGR
jgi:hypothetical protein